MEKCDFAMAIILVVMLSILSFTTAFPLTEKELDNHRNGTKYPMIFATSPEEEMIMVQTIGIQGRILTDLFQDNSDSGKKTRLKKIRYLYRNPKNLWEPLLQSGEGWNDNSPLKVIIHGFSPNLLKGADDLIRGQQIFDVGEAYDKQYNVIVVDWTPLSKEPLHKYHEAAASTRYVGEAVANFLINLHKTKLISNWNDVHIIGFSLGAHVSGVAGFQIQELTKSKVGRITGLDPAGPNFDESGQLPKDASIALDKTDAEFVDIIHCNMGNIVTSVGGRLGSTVVAGHVDFYPNGGETQKGCNILSDGTSSCSHGACVKHFINSINKPILACPCDSWEKFTSGSCKCTGENGGMNMGEMCSNKASGKFYLETDEI